MIIYLQQWTLTWFLWPILVWYALHSKCGVMLPLISHWLEGKNRHSPHHIQFPCNVMVRKKCIMLDELYLQLVSYNAGLHRPDCWVTKCCISMYNSHTFFSFLKFHNQEGGFVICRRNYEDIMQRAVTTVVIIIIYLKNVLTLCRLHGNKAVFSPQIVILSFFPCFFLICAIIESSLSLHLHWSVKCGMPVLSQFMSVLSVVYRYDTICCLLYHI